MGLALFRAFEVHARPECTRQARGGGLPVCRLHGTGPKAAREAKSTEGKQH